MNKQKQTCRYWKQTSGYQRGDGEDEPGAWDEAEGNPAGLRRRLRSLTAKLPQGRGVLKEKEITAK